MSEQRSCPHCHNWVSSQAWQCPHCGASLQADYGGASPGYHTNDPMVHQAPPTEPGATRGSHLSIDFLEDNDRTVVSKGPRHAEEFGVPEEEEYPTLQMEGHQAAALRDEASQVELSSLLFEDDLDRTQVNTQHPSSGPALSSDMWQTPSQDAWNSPFAGQAGWSGQQGGGWSAQQGGPQYEQPTYSGPVDIARAAGSESDGRRRGRMLWVVLVLLIAGGGFVAAYVYLLPMLASEPNKKARKVFVVMEVETDPKGASVWVDGRRQTDPTPTALSVRIGRTVQVQLRKEGYETVDFQWRAGSYERRKFFLRALAKPRPRPRESDPPIARLRTPAARRRPRPRPRRRVRRRPRYPSVVLSLRTVPSGAKVRINGQVRSGKTPMRLSLREGRKVKVTVQKYGHQDAYFVWPAIKSETHTIKLYRHSWYNP